MIPKLIHYIWLGRKQKSKLTELCINTWRRNLPEYTLCEWNEKNLKLDELCKQNKFLAKCVKLKLWAFVSDYLRLYIIYNYGGIYFDTDVEVIKSFNDLLPNSMFIGYESNDYICTAVIGAEKNNKSIKRLLDFYSNEIWDVEFINNPIVFRYLFEKEPYVFKECKIFDRDYFAPYAPGQSCEKLIEALRTYAIHWYTANWNMSIKGYVFVTTKHIKNPIKKKLAQFKKVLGYCKHKLKYFLKGN